MVLPSNASSADESFESHMWKSEFATTRSGRNSPNIFAKFRRKFLTAPPIRNVKSPKFTEEELDALTGDLPYETNYTYAYSKIYDPSLPDHWEVPNLRASANSPVYVEDHYSASSISQKIIYLLRLPFVLILHMIFYTLNLVKNGTTLTVFGIWEYFFYCIRKVADYLDTWKRGSRVHSTSRTTYVRSTLQNTSEYFSRILQLVLKYVTMPFRLSILGASKDDTGINNIRETRATRTTEKQARSNINRNVNSPSLSPSRSTRNSSKVTSVNSKVFYQHENDTSHEIRTLRSVKNRSITPVRQANVYKNKKTITSQTFQREDTPLSFYGLRSRNIERNTPEPTFERRIVNREETDTRRKNSNEIEEDEENSSYIPTVFAYINQTKIISALTIFAKYVIYAVLIPYFAIRHVYCFIIDNWPISHYDRSTRYSLRSRKSGNKTVDISNGGKDGDDIRSVVIRKRTEIAPIENIPYDDQPMFIELIPALLKANLPWTSRLSAIAQLCVIDFALIHLNAYHVVAQLFEPLKWKKWLLLAFLLLLIFYVYYPKENVNPKIDEFIIVGYSEQPSPVYDSLAAFGRIIRKPVAVINSAVLRAIFNACELIIMFVDSSRNYILSLYQKSLGLPEVVKDFLIRTFYYKILIPCAAVGATLAELSDRIIYFVSSQNYGIVLQYLSSALQNIWTFLYLLFSTPIFKAIELYKAIPSIDINPPVIIREANIREKEVNIPAVPSKIEQIPVIMPNPQPQVIEIDQAKIIAEITNKLRTELSAKFHSELTLEFEKNYQAIIEKLTVQNNNFKVDNSNLEALIRQMIYEYDADKTGKVDYALESSGASVISTRCSETYNSYSRLEKIWNIPLWYSTYGPRTVIQRNSKTLFPGECWSFKNDRGYLTIDLSHHIDISSVSYEHIGKELAPGGNRQSAPKDFKIWAYKQVDDIKSRILVGEYTYDLDGPQLQFFIAQNHPSFPVKIIELEVTSNYGAMFTCLYRLRVHGKVHQF